MAINVQNYKVLEDFKKGQAERSSKLLSYQEEVSKLRSRLFELQTQYELTFTKSVKTGKDATADLDKIDNEIKVTKEQLERKELDFTLFNRALEEAVITTVDVVAKYQSEFANVVQREFENKVNPKLQLARDLILSALDDRKEYMEAYDDTHEEVKEIMFSNRSSGKTDYITLLSHPVEYAKVFNRNGAISGVRELLDQVSKYTFGTIPSDYKYIEAAPTVKTNEKVGK